MDWLSPTLSGNSLNALNASVGQKALTPPFTLSMVSAQASASICKKQRQNFGASHRSVSRFEECFIVHSTGGLCFFTRVSFGVSRAQWQTRWLVETIWHWWRPVKSLGLSLNTPLCRGTLLKSKPAHTTGIRRFFLFSYESPTVS